MSRISGDVGDVVDLRYDRGRILGAADLAL
jgi:hypothetical protein